MGIVESELAVFELADGTGYRIELNRNERIHLHVETVRIDMTVEEFEYFVEVVSEAKEELLETKALDP